MVDLSDIFNKTVGLVWEYQYRIPEPAFWLALVASLVLGTATLGIGAWLTLPLLAAIAISGSGIARWRIARARSKGAIVVTRFRCSDRGKAGEIQDTIINSLQDHLSGSEIRLVSRVPAEASNAQKQVASRLCKRLRAFMVVSGDIRSAGEGEWSVYASACQPLDPVVQHLDQHTRDLTPSKASWRWTFRRLTGIDLLPNREYPIEFAHELQAVVRGISGQMALKVGHADQAERLLGEAIAVAPESESHLIDRLRTDRAGALLQLDRQDEAIDLLRTRSTAQNASPELLRCLDLVLRFFGDPTDAEVEESFDALRRAADDRSDPQRDMTLLNLAQGISFSPNETERDEGEVIVRDLLQSDGHYRKAWFIRRLLGVFAYRRFEETRDAGTPDPKFAADAARWYSAAIRARPHFKLLANRGQGIRLVTRYGIPPIMFANAKDACQGAGHFKRML